MILVNEDELTNHQRVKMDISFFLTNVYEAATVSFLDCLSAYLANDHLSVSVRLSRKISCRRVSYPTCRTQIL